MRQRRFAQAPTSDDEDNAPLLLPRTRSSGSSNLNRRKRKLVHFQEDEEGEQKEEDKLIEQMKKRGKNEEPESENVDVVDVEPQPMGTVVRVSGKGKGKRTHYECFEYNGQKYCLEDPALFHPETQNQKPYVAIIKDIAKTYQGNLKITGQWFYRPEEAKKKGGGSWVLNDTRELFYSFHRDEVPAESIFHKCVVHFVPLNKRIPARQQHPGFIVQRVYDTEQRMLFRLTDKDYEEEKQNEIDLLVQKTLARIGSLSELKDVDNEDRLKNKRLLRRRNMPPLYVSRENEGLSRSQSIKLETPGSVAANSSEYYAILSNFKVLTGETQRDRWLEKLLQSIQYMCTHVGGKRNDGEERVGLGVTSAGNKSGRSNNESHDRRPKGGVCFAWPDAAIASVIPLEKAAHGALYSDFQKYNQKMRQLAFNFKSNAALAQRVLSKELEPAQILNMSPIELKEGLTAEEIVSRQPEESGHWQMTDARCERCTEKQVGLIDIIQTGHGDRYQLECVACGNTWYASRDDAATLTMEVPSLAITVGTAPLATTDKFDDVEVLVSPSRAAKGSSTDAALDKQKPFNETRTKEKPTSAI